MIKEQELKNKCTPEFTKWMCEHAEGFGYIDYVLSQSSDLEQVRFNNIIFPLLIHRAVEGWNKKCPQHAIHTWSSLIECLSDCELPPFDYYFKNYQPKSLTHAECAMLDCLLDVFKTGGER